MLPSWIPGSLRVPGVKRPESERRTDVTLLQPHAKHTSKAINILWVTTAPSQLLLGVCVVLSTMRFLHLIRPVMCVLPEVASPDRKVHCFSRMYRRHSLG
jgi:hypothetical protein